MRLDSELVPWDDVTLIERSNFSIRIQLLHCKWGGDPTTCSSHLPEMSTSSLPTVTKYGFSVTMSESKQF